MKQRILGGVAIMAMFAFLTGCDEIKFGGTLNVNELITFAQDTKAFTSDEIAELGSRKPAANVILAPGQYPAKITLGKNTQKKFIKMEITNGAEKTVVKLNFDKNIEIGNHFELSADQIKQSFGLTGDILTNITQTPEQSTQESCTYQDQEMVCRGRSVSNGVDPELSDKVTNTITEFARNTDLTSNETPDAPAPAVEKHGHGHHHGGYNNGHHPGPHPGPQCHWVTVTRHGWQYVRFYYETTTKDITARFVQPGKDLANYSGRNADTNKIYTYRGTCR